ncbi:hypothetical protein K402DRAFT_186277 [Aulographum hederae CBS 113979]|uniref:Uncharacterized protein n=1 Tax=Aulographum hederae CBS 113979 TaxID=1176131 RepID=A0A6G1GPF4_9PEZI|nr:hypothetical protein K402DRAFT_186277 [Aulographum hederae CBS 113979]
MSETVPAQENGEPSEPAEERERRELSEAYHASGQKREIYKPVRIGPPHSDVSSRPLRFGDFFGDRAERPLHEITPDDCRRFCWRDCAIYSTRSMGFFVKIEFLDDVYREWYPHRAMDKDVSNGSFFAKFMRFSGSEQPSLSTIAGFHAALCDKLQELEKDISYCTPPHPTRPHMFRPGRALYRLRDTFNKVFIVLDLNDSQKSSWRERGVLVVWKSEDEATRHHCSEGGEVTRCDDSEVGDLGQACAFRCSLQTAMKMVVSMDLERTIPRVEYSYFLEEMDDEISLWQLV